MVQIKEFWKKNERNIVLLIGFSLIAVISFEVGFLKGSKMQNSPIIIEKSSEKQEFDLQEAKNSIMPTDSSVSQKSKENQISDAKLQECRFVGSKNSNKYHLPTCRWAKQIKPENIVCFSSSEEASQKGYQPDKNCIK